MRNRFFAGLAFFLMVGMVVFVLLTAPESIPAGTLGLISGG